MGHQSEEDSVLIIVEGHPFAAAVGVGRASIRRPISAIGYSILLRCTAAFLSNGVVLCGPNVRTTAHEAPRVHHAARRRGGRMATRRMGARARTQLSPRRRAWEPA